MNTKRENHLQRLLYEARNERDRAELALAREQWKTLAFAVIVGVLCFLAGVAL